MDRRQLLKLIGAMATAGATGAAASGCTSEPQGTAMEQPSGRTIVVGLIAPAVGAYSRIGDEITKGFKLYLEDHNYLVGTHTVDLRIKEEGATVETAVAAADKLLKEGAIAIAGVANPAALPGVANLAETARVPLLGAGASPSAFPSKVYTWRACYVEGEAGRALAPYALAEGNKAYVMYDDTPTAKEEGTSFVEQFSGLGGQIVGQASGKGSYAARLNSARALGARTIFAAYSGNEALAVLDAYRAANIQPKLIGPSSLTESLDLTKLDAVPPRVYTAGFYAPDLDNEENRRFVSNYHKVYGVPPTSYAMTGYDVVSVLDKVLRLVGGEPDSANVNRGLSLLGRIDSPRGAWSFNTSRTPQQKWYLRKLRLDGQVVSNLLDNDLAVLS